MMDGISGMGAPPSSVLTPPGGALGKEEFLQLLVAQLRNQDPMNPMESQEFAAQLAQFSSVEQLINVNENLIGQAQYTAALAQAMNSDAAVSVLGRQVLAVGDRTQVAAGSARIPVEVGAVGGSATVRIYDDRNQLVAEVDAGFVEGGRQTLELDALDLEDGTYRCEVEVTSPAGEPVGVTTYLSGTVSSVKYSMEGPVLMIGAIEIPLSAVVEVSAN